MWVPSSIHHFAKVYKYCGGSWKEVGIPDVDENSVSEKASMQTRITEKQEIMGRFRHQGLSQFILIALLCGSFPFGDLGFHDLTVVEAASFIASSRRHIPNNSAAPGTNTSSRAKASSKQTPTNTVCNLQQDDECPLPDDEDVSYPHPDLNAEQVTKICMDALRCRKPEQSLEICFNYSTDRCRAAVGGSLDEFIQYANNPVFGKLINCEYNILSVGPIIAGSVHRGAMQTVLIDVQKALNVGDVIKAAQQQQQNSGSPQQQRRRPSARERRKQRLLAEQGKDAEAIEENGSDGGSAKPVNGKQRFLWTLQQERRPPRQDCWLVHEVMFVENAGMLTV